MFPEINIIINRSDDHPSFDLFRTIFGQSPDLQLGNVAVSRSGNIRYYVNGNIHIFLYGEIYDRLDLIQNLNDVNNPEILNLLPLINGSFFTVMVDNATNKTFIVTDRINSRKLYYRKNSTNWILTNNPQYFPKIDNELDLGGIACYLINGVVFNNNTLYRNIRIFDRASIYQIDNQEFSSKYYWQYAFTEEFKGIPKNELKKKFSHLLMKSVSRRIDALKPEVCYLSLSGGYDSRFLLGALREFKNDLLVRTFSYGTETKLDSGDDFLAEKISASIGFKHQMIPAYLNDFVGTINLNAEYGFGLSNFCDEVDAWMQLSDQFKENPSSLLFVGDMYYMPSRDYDMIKDKRISLYASKIYPWHYLSPFLKYLPKNISEDLVNGYSSIFQGILERLPSTKKFNDLKDFVYLDQRITHKLMLWRELFHSPFIKVAIPLLDNDVLDFIRKLPVEYRHKKALYKETIREMFPDLFEFPMAKNVWAYPSWHEESIRSYRDVYNQIISRNSKLDQIISPEIISFLVKSKDNFKEDKPQKFYRVIRKLSGKFDFVNDVFADYLLKNYLINADNLITRLLLLKRVL